MDKGEWISKNSISQGCSPSFSNLWMDPPLDFPPFICTSLSRSPYRRTLRHPRKAGPRHGSPEPHPEPPAGPWGSADCGYRAKITIDNEPNSIWTKTNRANHNRDRSSRQNRLFQNGYLKILLLNYII